MALKQNQIIDKRHERFHGICDTMLRYCNYLLSHLPPNLIGRPTRDRSDCLRLAGHRALPAPAPSAQRAFHAFLLLDRSRLRRSKRVEGAFERRSGQLGAIHTGQRVPKSLAACVAVKIGSYSTSSNSTVESSSKSSSLFGDAFLAQ